MATANWKLETEPEVVANGVEKPAVTAALYLLGQIQGTGTLVRQLIPRAAASQISPMS